MKIIGLLLVMILIAGCTSIRIGKEDMKIIKNETKENQSIIKNLETKIEEKIPKISTETDYDTPEIVQSRTLKETEAEDFGDVI